MRRTMHVFAALAFVALLLQPAEAISVRAQCRLECTSAIAACIDAGGKRRRCRRGTLRRCRHDGLTVCTAGGATTTSTKLLVPATTTTLGAVNSCDPATATDLRGSAQVTISFGDTLGLHYDPACFTVSPGTQVIFSGSFPDHPLVGGRVDGVARIPDPSSPFGGPTSAGSSKSLTLADPGAFPFYCDFHASTGMNGAAFVVP